MSKMENVTTSGRKPRNTYDVDFKRQVLDVWYSGTYTTIIECAKSYGINDNTLNTWLHLDKKSPPVSSSINLEMISLKKELTKARMELDILKKAAIYFANHAK